MLAQQDFVPRINNRITRVLVHIGSNLAMMCSIEELAAVARLSKSQFKTEFKNQTGQSSGKYLMMRRMEKARALLANTGLPVHIVAEIFGCTSQSAFTRRFSWYFGDPPNRFVSR
jgi:transcriptional regulator GlxA family with amidase domain